MISKALAAASGFLKHPQRRWRKIAYYRELPVPGEMLCRAWERQLAEIAVLNEPEVGCALAELGDGIAEPASVTRWQ